MFKLKKHLSLILTIVLLYGLLYVIGIGCPIRFITGISCPGCGMTRAWLSALHLDFKSAFYYHPLFFTVPIIILVILCKNHVNKRVYNIFLIVMIASYVTIYAIRLIQGSDIVAFRPYDNILFRLIRTIKL